MNVPVTISRGSLTVFLNGVPSSIDNSHPHYQQILDLFKEQKATPDVLEPLLSVRKFIQSKLTFGKVTIGQDAIYYDGEPVHSHLTQRMLEIIQAGIDIKPWALFMDNLYRNPSRTAVQELYLWLEQSGMPITDDGHFLAYKKVRDDFGSFHDGGKTENKIDTVVSMPRNQVDDNRHNTCSQGLHFCSWQYLPSYYGDQGRVVVVKIDPADVVSIPSDYGNAKGRAWQYLVLSEVDQDKAQFAFSGVNVYSTAAYADSILSAPHEEDDEIEEEEDEEEYHSYYGD